LLPEQGDNIMRILNDYCCRVLSCNQPPIYHD